MKKKLFRTCLAVCLVLSILFNVLLVRMIIYEVGWETISKQVMWRFSGKVPEGEGPYPYWTHKVTQFSILNESLPKNKVVFLGDSITDGFLVQEFNTEIQIFNRGISGDTTEGILKRLDKTVLNLNPSKLFIMAGINDVSMGVSVGDIISNYEKIIEKLRSNSPNTRIYIQSVLPVGKNAFKGLPSKLNVITEINNRLKEISSKDNMVQYIEIGDLLKDEKGFLKESYSKDGIHINGQAYKLWNDLIKENLLTY